MHTSGEVGAIPRDLGNSTAHRHRRCELQKGTGIPRYNHRPLTFDLGYNRVFRRTLVVADIPYPIDARRRKIDRQTLLTVTRSYAGMSQIPPQ